MLHILIWFLPEDQHTNTCDTLTYIFNTILQCSTIFRIHLSNKIYSGVFEKWLCTYKSIEMFSIRNLKYSTHSLCVVKSVFRTKRLRVAGLIVFLSAHDRPYLVNVFDWYKDYNTLAICHHSQILHFTYKSLTKYTALYAYADSV